jgi:hypothetical protein
MIHGFEGCSGIASFMAKARKKGQNQGCKIEAAKKPSGLLERGYEGESGTNLQS